MSYGQRVATFEQFSAILKNSAENKVRYAPSADQISGLMEGVTVSLRLQEMSVDYGEAVSQSPLDYYVPRVRVHATVLFDYGTYVVDVMEADWFALPSVDQWQASLPVIYLPSEMIDKVLDETETEPPNESLRKGARKAQEMRRVKRDTEDGDEGGTAGVRVPAPTPTPSGGTAADLPSEATVG